MKKSTQYGVSKSQEFGQFTPASGRQAAELREQRIYFPSLLFCPRFHISLWCSPSSSPSLLPVADAAIPQEFFKACVDVETVSPIISGSTTTEECRSSSRDAANGSPFSSPEVTQGLENEAKWYYYGIPSTPRLVFRTGGTPWQGHLERKELRPVFDDHIAAVCGEMAHRSSFTWIPWR